MLQSKLFTKTKKEAPTDEVSRNAELLIRAGFINKEMAGVYSYLPFGLKVLKKIEDIIREEMNILGAQEITLTALQEKATWEPTNQWSDDEVDVWFKTKLKNDTELGLGWSHEAQMTKMLKEFVQSYRDLPQYIYQFQTKFRNETRAKSGIMRTREFIMKDMYSFDIDEKSHLEFYEKTKQAYKNIFKKVGIGHITYLTFASGGAFAKFSHEFQTVTGVGEDTIYVDEGSGIAINQEVFTDEIVESLGLSKDKMVENRAIEVGNIFTLSTRFSDALDLKFQSEQGEKISAFMGSYGIGPARLMGTVVEVLSDDKGIIWPESIAPFKVHLLSLGDKDDVKKSADNLYQILNEKGVEILYDDRVDIMAGEKFADADLIGIPYRVVVSERSLKDGGYEIKKRIEDKGKIVNKEELLNEIISQ